MRLHNCSLPPTPSGLTTRLAPTQREVHSKPAQGSPEGVVHPLPGRRCKDVVGGSVELVRLDLALHEAPPGKARALAVGALRAEKVAGVVDLHSVQNGVGVRVQAQNGCTRGEGELTPSELGVDVRDGSGPARGDGELRRALEQLGKLVEGMKVARVFRGPPAGAQLRGWVEGRRARPLASSPEQR